LSALSFLFHRSVITAWLISAPIAAFCQVLLELDDYGPVISSTVWYGSRLPGLTCNMPRADQITVPNCPECIVIEARPHIDHPNLVELELATETPFNDLVNFYRSVDGVTWLQSVSSDHEAFFVNEAQAELSAEEFILTKTDIPYIAVQNIQSNFGHSRQVTIVAEHDSSYNCVFDHDG